jgi:hypothetical protein
MVTRYYNSKLHKKSRLAKPSSDIKILNHLTNLTAADFWLSLQTGSQTISRPSDGSHRDWGHETGKILVDIIPEREPP